MGCLSLMMLSEIPCLLSKKLWRLRVKPRPARSRLLTVFLASVMLPVSAWANTAVVLQNGFKGYSEETDTYISSSQPNRNFSVQQTLNSSSLSVNKIIMRFGLDPIPIGAVILKAEISLSIGSSAPTQ